jgi:malate dehydrogenase (oxaloacetate-decarboxylating)(NADP+)
VALQDRNETLFYRVLLDHMEEMMPIVYTPVVGKACQLYGHIFRRPRGMFLSALDKGNMYDILGNWESDAVRVIVVTDGERILGLGDLGANGMGIPVGKLTLYSACAGVDPACTLPVTLDVGTNNESLLNDPLYLGIRHRRHRGAEYDELIEEFVDAATRRWPGVLIQFEDFANANSFRLLEKYRDRICTFNDDIQGTAAVTLSGIFSALRITGQPITEQRVLFLGAGSAGVGIARLLSGTMAHEGLPEAEARLRCWFVDSRGLVVKSRTDLQGHKLEFAHDLEPVPDFLGAIRKFRPTVIVGASGRAGSFSREMIEEMARINERPVVFALSNPTAQAECTAQQACEWSEGRVIYASGSPFPPVRYAGRTIVPGQGNNAYIFPGVGLGVIACGARHVTDEMLVAAARALTDDVSDDDLAIGCIFPPLARIRETSLRIATAVAKVAYDQGLATAPEPEDLREFVRESVFEPVYPRYA